MIKTLIIEDEAPAADRLGRMLREIEPGVDIVDVLESVSETIRWFDNNPQPDLLMLDIQLADGLSFDILKKIRIESFVIFTTAYDEYAIKAFELNSIDYLLKPVNREKLKKAVEKYKKLSSESRNLDIQAVIDAIDRGKKKYKERFAISIGARIKSVETNDIAYFYSLDRNTFLCTYEDRHYPVDFSLDKLEEILDPGDFFRISRRHIINYKAIEKITVLSKSRVAIHTNPPVKEPFMVSTARTHEFRLWLDR
jgi:two-component system response regulator LytT